MPRATKVTKNRQSAHPEDLDLNALFPSQSSGTDDSMADSLVQKWLEKSEKARRKRDAQFCSILKRESQKMSKAWNSQADQFQEDITNLREAYMVERAENEDSIRKLWTTIAQEVGMQLQVMQQSVKTSTVADKDRGKASDKQLATARRTCEDSDQIIASLDPSLAD